MNLARGLNAVEHGQRNGFVDSSLIARRIGSIPGCPLFRLEEKTQTRDRRRATGARVEGRKSRLQRLRDAKATDAVTNLEAAVGPAKRLRRASPVTGKRMSLRKISAELAKAGHLNEQGRPYNPKSVLASSMDRGPSRMT